MSSRSVPSSFLKNVLQNGVGRYVCQLQRITLNFCKSHASSRGMRDFIENHLLDFTRNNSGIVVYLKPRRHNCARLVAEYLNGGKDVINVNNKNKDEICKWIEHLRTRSGVKIVRLRKMWRTENSSIQGVWHPFTNKDPKLNVSVFPDQNLSQFIPSELSATEVLLERARKLRLQDPPK